MLTTRMQIHLLADALAGLPAQARLQEFSEPWRTCWAAVENAPQPKYHALSLALEDHPDREQILKTILNTLPGTPLRTHVNLTELAKTLPPLGWVWPDWLPRGLLTLMGAVPGAGKSFLALDIARRIIHGETFPDGRPVPNPGSNVVYVDAEAVPQILYRRARDWSLDTDRVFLLLPEDGGEIDLNLPACRDELLEKVYDLRPDLVIVDSLSSITTKGENNIEDVRSVLNFLKQLALDYQIGLLLIHHLRKTGGGQLRSLEVTLDDFRGSGHITATARSVWGLSIVQTGPKPDRNGPRRLEVLKTNLCAYPDLLGFELRPNHPSGVHLGWGPVPEPYQEPTQLDYCKTWLIDQLTGAGEQGLRPRTILARGEGAGYSRATIYRAREEIAARIANTETQRHPDNRWVLAA